MQSAAVPPGDDHLSAIERRLATILMADVFGYSRMMGEDEERTVRIFRGHRAVFDELLLAHRGRVFNTAGDAILAEFPSAVEAVRCATEIQAALRTRNEQLPEAQRMWFRIGINLGDVIVQGADLLGDGVNVAARIQTVAEPGGVCISGSVYDQIQNKLTLQIRQLGEKSFKNIAQPVRTFSIGDDIGGAASGVRWRASRKGPVAITAGIVAVLIAVSGAGYWWYRDHDARVAEETRRADLAQRAVEAQRRADLDNAAAAAVEKEAKLQAELQSAKDALMQAEASKRKADADRAAAEIAQREAKLQGDLKAAKEALQKATESERKAEQARSAATSAVKGAEAAVQNSAAAAADARPAAPVTPPPGAGAAAASSKAAAATGQGVDRYDGIYAGRMCSVNADGSPRCWDLGLTARHGALSGSWITRYNNQPGNAKGTIAADGAIDLTLDGFNLTGKKLEGTATGQWADNKITVAGNWNNGVPVNATWTLAPDAPVAQTTGRQQGTDNANSSNEPMATPGRGRRARR
jgi:class 3 adenylate cyclase